MCKVILCNFYSFMFWMTFLGFFAVLGNFIYNFEELSTIEWLSIIENYIVKIHVTITNSLICNKSQQTE
jgi:hypothetical protein